MKWWDYRESKYGWNKGSRFVYKVVFEKSEFNVTVSSKYFKRHFKPILQSLFWVPEVYRNWIKVINLNGRGKQSGGGANWRHSSIG